MVRFTISDHAIGRFRERFAPELSDTESRLLLSRLLLSAKRTGSSFRDRSVWSVNESGPFKGMRVVAKEGRFLGKGSLMSPSEFVAQRKRRKLAERLTWMLAVIKVGPSMTATIMAERLTDGRMTTWDRA